MPASKICHVNRECPVYGIWRLLTFGVDSADCGTAIGGAYRCRLLHKAQGGTDLPRRLPRRHEGRHDEAETGTSRTFVAPNLVPA